MFYLKNNYPIKKVLGNKFILTWALTTKLVTIEQQSADITQSVHLNKSEEELGAGDQGNSFLLQ